MRHRRNIDLYIIYIYRERVRENQGCIDNDDDIHDKNRCDKKIDTKQSKKNKKNKKKQNHLMISTHKDYMSPFVPMSPFVKTKCPR
jgi:hypothetical protein